MPAGPIRLKSGGLWVQTRPGAWRRVPWTVWLLPPLLLLIVAFGTALSANHADDLLPWFVVDHPKAAEEGWTAYRRANEVALSNLVNLEQPRRHSELPTLDLFLGDGVIERMLKAKVTGSRDLGRAPGGDRPYFPAYYIDESEKLQKAKVGLRGWGSHHHSPRKPSLRIKIRKTDVALGLRYVELQPLEGILGLTNYLPEQLIRTAGGLGNTSEYVRLFVNRKFKGVYLRSARAEEALALKLGRLPGPFFKGDALGNYQGVDLWAGVKNWRVFEETPQSVIAFEAMLELMRQPRSPQNLDNLREYLDFEAFARWHALMLMIGSMHSDYHHNHLYFLDPLSGLLEPVVWDANAFVEKPELPLDRIPSPIIDWLSRDPRWVHSRNKWLHHFLQNDCSPDNFAALMEETMARVGPDLKADSSLVVSVPTALEGVYRSEPFPVERTEEVAERTVTWMKQRAAFVEDYLTQARVATRIEGDQTLVVVYGNVAVHVLGSPDGKEVLYPGRTGTPQTDNVTGRTPAPLTYRIAGTDLQFTNAITGQPVQTTSTLPPTAPLLSVPISAFPEHPLTDRTLGPGVVTLEQDLKVEGTLTVLPGTTLALEPSVSILCTGPVKMQGTARAPIVVRPAGSEPWGSISLVGERTSNSLFEHVQMEGGSEGLFRGIRFKGMFNVYSSRALTLRNCRFGVNHTSDDAVNLAGSEFTAEGCEWVGARSDGLDSDKCEGKLTDCTFRDTGNDGLDLMDSTITVTNCRFSGCGDKGLSVGEGSRTVVRDSEFKRCEIGSQVKDSSQAVYLDCQFLSNKLALNAYRKKWLYPSGGHFLLKRCTISGPGETLTRDRSSTARVVGMPDFSSDQLTPAAIFPEPWPAVLQKVLEDAN